MHPNDTKTIRAYTDPRVSRQSNMETVRILAMSMILTLHIIAHTSVIHVFPTIRYFMPIVVGGVDLFILISGYYTIKLTWKSVLWFVILVWAFQTCILASLYITGNIGSISYLTIIGTYMNPLVNNEYWFIQKYFMLMLISPLFNTALKHITNYRYAYLLALLTIIDIYAFWMMQLYNKNTGVSLYNFIYLYVLGQSISRFNVKGRIKPGVIVAAGLISLMLNLIINALTLWYFSSDFGSYMNSYTYNYCNPLTITVCVCVIILMSKQEYYSKIINSVASASLGAYLLQDGLLGTLFTYNYQSQALNASVTRFAVLTVAIFLSYWVVSWLITYIMRYVYIRLTRCLDKIIPSRYKFNFAE